MLIQARSWRELAAATGGHLFRGNMSILGGRVDDATFDLRTRLDEASAATATRLSVHLLRPFRDEDLARATSPEVRELRAALEREGGRVVIDEGSLELVHEPALAELGDVRARVGALRLLERRLRGERGPRGYR